MYCERQTCFRFSKFHFVTSSCLLIGSEKCPVGVWWTVFSILWRKSQTFSNIFFLTSRSESSGNFNRRFKLNFLHSLSDKSRQFFFRYFVGSLKVIYPLFCWKFRGELSQYFVGRLMVNCLYISFVVHSDFSQQYFGRFTVNYFDIISSVSLSVFSIFCLPCWKRNSAFQVSAKIVGLISRNVWRKYKAENES